MIYDRAAGKLLRKEEFADDAAALEARFAAEQEHGLETNVEILAISAASEVELRRTHGRYFMSSDELGERLVGAAH